jgi:hypothetical protein
LNLKSKQYGTTALVTAISAERPECIELLRKAGAFDDTATAENGEPITLEHPALAVCAAYNAAILAHDGGQMKVLSVPERNLSFDDADWDSWGSSRPIEPGLVQGFVSGDDATIALAGATPGGYFAMWVFQLRRDDDKWLVVRERWATRGL